MHRLNNLELGRQRSYALSNGQWVRPFLGSLGLARRRDSSGSMGWNALSSGRSLIRSNQRVGQPIRSGMSPMVPAVKEAPLFMKPRMQRPLKREPIPLDGEWSWA
jgi:hypothetical protein